MKIVDNVADALAAHGEELAKLSKQIEILNARLEGLVNNVGVLGAPAAKPKPVMKKPTGNSVALLGTRGHGKKHMAAFNKLKNVYISWIVDVDEKVGKAAVEEIFKTEGYRPKFTTDYREMLKDPGVEAVSIATPHHLHALQTIDSLKAGKHVYVEKPVTQCYSERYAVKAAAEKYGRMVQAGTQLRSNTSLAEAGKFMRDGGIGDIVLVHCIVHKTRPPVPLSNDAKVPASVDYSLWSGPRPEAEVTRSKFHYHWHWLWDYGNGALGNNGIHRVDAARFALDLKGYGDTVLSMGGRYGPQDSGETPNNMLTLHRFGDTWLLQDILGLNPEPYQGMENAVVFYGTEGTIVYKAGAARLVDENFKDVRRFEGKQLNHYYNFLQAIRENDASLLRGDLEEGLISSELCHLGNASYRLGETSNFDNARAVLRDLNAPDMVLNRLDALERNLEQNDVAKEVVIGPNLTLGDVGSTAPFGLHPRADELLGFKKSEAFPFPEPDKV